MIRGSRFRTGAVRFAAATALAALLAAPAIPRVTHAQELASGEAISGAPAVPVAVAPADGAVFASWSETPPFSWTPSEGATDYQVVINDGERTGPWVGREKWEPGDLGEGTFTWQVMARSQGGTSDLSAPSTFTVSADAAQAPTVAGDGAAAGADAPPRSRSRADGAADTTGEADPAAEAPIADDPAPDAVAVTAAGPTLALDAAAPLTVGEPITLSGGGFTPGENVIVRWLGDQGPVKGTATAAEDGSFTFGLDVPETPIGDRPVVAIGESDGKQAVAWYVIAPAFTITPAEAGPGDTVTLTLLGYGPSEPWEVRWGGDAVSAWQSGETDANGTARLEAFIPEGSAGPHTLVGRGLSSGAALDATLTLIDPAPASAGVTESPAGDAVAADAPAAPEPASEPVVQGTMTEGEIVAPPASVVETTSDPAAAPEPSGRQPKPEQGQDPAREREPNPNQQAREENQVAIANQMREQFGLPPIPPEQASAGAESAGAVAEEVSVDATMNGYLEPDAALGDVPSDVDSTEASAVEGELAVGQDASLARYTDSGQVPIPSAVYELLPNPDALGAVERTPQDRRDQRADQRAREQDRRDRDRSENGSQGDGHDGAPVAPDHAGEPSAAAPETAHDPALPTPAPGTRLSFIPASDTSTGADAPDDPQPEIQVAVLPIGGPDSAAAFLTFDISGIGGGDIASATLTVTGAIGFWGPVSVTAIPGYWVDEGSLTWNTAPGGEIAATGANGSPSGYPELPADGVVSADVTGVVSGDGLITFVLRGTPDVGQAIGSRESGIPAVLEIVTK